MNRWARDLLAMVVGVVAWSSFTAPFEDGDTVVFAAILNVTPTPDGSAIDLVSLRDRVRTMRSTLAKDETVEVVFAPGEYTVTNTVALYKADGRAVWRAEKPGSVVFRGATDVPRERFKETAVNGVRARVADVADLLPGVLAPWPKELRRPPAPWLYRNRRPLELARWPNNGDWATFANAVVSAQDEADAAKGGKQADAIAFSDARAAKWDFAKGIWFYGYWCHDWAESFVQGADYDAAKGQLRFSGRHQYGFGGKTWGFSERRFFALNALSELDAPGEWYLDREAKRLYVVPQDGEETARYSLAVLTSPFVKADGLGDFRFENLVFECAHANTAVQLDNSEGVRLSGCTFVNLGGKALQLTGHDSYVERCRFAQIGAACIVLAGGDRKTLKKGNLVVDGCTFLRWARFERTYNPGILLRGCGNVVRRSVFRDAPHNAILFQGNDHLIESNEFDRVLMETGDAGALYTGRNPSEMGTLIRGNWFHDLGDPDKRDYTSAVYFDDCDWGDSVVSNRFERLGRGVLLGGGNLFRIEGNSFSECRIGIHVDSRGKSWKQWTDHPEWFAEKFAPFTPLDEEWRAAYPKLEATLSDDSFAPWNNALVGNRFSGCGRDFQFDKGVLAVTNRMEISGNQVVK